MDRHFSDSGLFLDNGAVFLRRAFRGVAGDGRGILSSILTYLP